MWGILGSSGGGDDNDRCAPSGRGRRPSLWDDGRNRPRNPLLRPCDSSEVVERDRLAWYGCDDSGWSLLEQDAIVGVYKVSRGWGVGRDCGAQDLSCLQWSVLKPECKKEGYGKKSGAGDS